MPASRRTLAAAVASISVATVAVAPAMSALASPVVYSGAVSGAGVRTGDPTVDAPPADAPYKNAKLPIADRVEDLLARMTLAEKVGQMTQTERNQVATDASMISAKFLGSLLSGGGSVPKDNTPTAWADMIDAFQREALTTRLAIPLVYGIDSVHGNGNLLGATVFPHNIALGATRDPKLAERIGHIVAMETRAAGPQWNFAPDLDAAQDDRWGRTYESFSENPALIETMETMIDGMQGAPGSGQLKNSDRVIATAKHYAGYGDTTYGTSTTGDFKIDRGITQTSKRDFWATSLRQYVPAVRDHDVKTVMPAYSSVDWTDDGLGNPIRMHAHKELITDVLKGQLGFDGFTIGDYNALDEIPGDRAAQVRTAVNAGLDMAMEASRPVDFIDTLTAEVAAGRVPMSRIDDAVRRILAVKFELGLFEKPFTDRRHIPDIGSAAHRQVARRAVAKSQVLLKNDAATLPLRDRGRIYVAGSKADNIGSQAGGWTLTWQGGVTNKIPGSTILDGIRSHAARAKVVFSEDASAPIRKSDIAIAVVGETPYSEGYGDVGAPGWPWDPADAGVPRPTQTMKLTAADQKTVDTVCAKATTCVVVLVSGRPLVLDNATVRKADALVEAWLPGSEGIGVADPLFGRTRYVGKLPMSWPRAVDKPVNVGDVRYNPRWAYGYGLTTKTAG